MYNKNSREAGTEEEVLLNTIRLVTAAFFLFHTFPYNIAMLHFLSKQHSNTEWTVRSFGFTATCNGASSVQGVHHTVVAVKLGLLLKGGKLALKFLPMLLYFTTLTPCPLAECSPSCRLSDTISMETSLTTVVHHTIVAVKEDFMMGKWLDLLIIIFYTLPYKVKKKHVNKMMQESKRMEETKSTNFALVVGVLQSFVAWTQFVLDKKARSFPALIATCGACRNFRINS